ncbi:unnamed protein product [Aphanomyces euteiches]|uniref:Protein kinase domain-containing protein n=1 Tax=Aphanomyces euteiches TaxID=100861 RepID=A0A6G0X6R9_9STRA|nr:hypothetical protein Ae201684_007958 [Aphanomyces euteiches]KAH9074490.1 hypothetical protein Ae201684P_022297 [Aphanomyces euteiches]KAH9101858.1 hypothetical protein LEN26_015654 [Aphanomyces euteiches]KAH9125566.1 hypothetical protein AeMF1_003848 [Aphanomyces euteiches]KAH9151285.1 hypothetical protein AeRB84_006070 [Aphanomyces euteiches]
MERYVEIRTIRDAIYGRVVLCHVQDRRHELVAIKMMSLAHMEAKTAVRGSHPIKEDGNEEFAILQRLSPHPSLLHLLDHFEHDQMLCLVFEYCPHGELFDYLHRQHANSKTRVSEKQAAIWFRQIVYGVQHIHGAGIAHRDVSLENILLDANQHCRICDFGLSSQEGKSCAGRVGKPFYMAPEVYDNQRYNGFKADVWSLGVLLFILLSGVPPLEVPSDVDARFRIIRQEGIHVLAKMWRVSLSKEALNLISHMLKTQPDERASLDDVASHPWLDMAGICPDPPTNQVRVA